MSLSLRTEGVETEKVGNDAVFNSLRSLYHRLQHGSYTRKDGTTTRIDGDTAKLKYAVGLTGIERKILMNFDHISQSVPGTLEIRKQIGHVTLAGEVAMGSSIFGTISPSERHGNTRIRLSRYRRNDPAVKYMDAASQMCVGCNYPPLSVADGAEFQVPDDAVRRQILARDPLCSAQSFLVHVLVVLAGLLSLRMCPDCPHCNAEGSGRMPGLLRKQRDRHGWWLLWPKRWSRRCR